MRRRSPRRDARRGRSVAQRRPENQEQPIHPLYGYIYITDLEEGLVLSTAATLLDGNPSNNHLRRAAAFNPDGRLRGARNLAIAGNYAYIVAIAGWWSSI